jgi:hypothetical protein
LGLKNFKKSLPLQTVTEADLKGLLPQTLKPFVVLCNIQAFSFFSGRYPKLTY